MFKIILIPILFLSLSACSLPFQKDNTPNPQAVEEIVSLTLTAQSSLTIDTAIPPADLSTETQTAVIVSVTQTPSFTVESTPTPTETASITVVPTGFKNTLGSPTWNDLLNDGSAFGIVEAGYEDDNTKIFMDNGAMVLSSSSLYGYRGWRLTVKSPTNVFLEAKFDVQSCSGADIYGLVYRAPDYTGGLGYYFGITCDGKYNVTRWTESGMTTIVSTTSSPVILSGPGQTNFVGIQMVGNNFIIHINNTMIYQFTDDSFSEGGHFGVFLAGQGAGNLNVRVDEISYWNLQ